MGITVSTNAQPDIHPPVVDILHPRHLEYTSCSEPGIYISITDSSPINWGSVFLTVSVDMHPYDLPESLASGPFGDIIIFPVPVELEHGDSVILNLAPVYDIYENGSLPIQWRFYADQRPPAISHISPSHAAVVRDLYQRIGGTIIDDDAGVNRDSSRIMIGTNNYPLSSPAVSWFSDSFFFDPVLAGVMFHGGDTVNVCISGADNAKYCGANRSDTCFMFLISSEGPIVELINPFNGAVISCPDSAIIISIYDVDGIDTNSIALVLDTDTVWISDPFLDYQAGLLVYDPEPPLAEGTYEVHLQVMDGLGNPPEEPFGFSFIVDVQPPYYSDYSPPPGARITDRNPTISLVIRDSIAGVNPTPILFAIQFNGISDHFTLFDVGFLDFDPVSGTLTFDPVAAGYQFSGGDTVNVCVIAYDSITFCPPNQNSFCWYFYLPATPPSAEIITPINGQISSCPDQSIILTVTDDEGIDPLSILLRVNGVDYTIFSPLLSFRRDSLIFTPVSPWMDGDEVRVSLIAARDSIGNDLAAPISWSFRIDLSGPEVNYTSPGDLGFTTDTMQVIRLRILDNISGVDPSTIELSVKGHRYSLLSPGMVWGGEYLSYSPGLAGSPFNLVDTVEVCLLSADDSPDLCPPNELQDAPYCWVFYIDAREPAYSPLDEIITACPDQETWIYLWSPLGFMPESMLVEINGVPYTIDSTQLTFINDTLRFTPSSLWEDGDTVRCLLVRAVDPIRSIDSVFWQFYVDYSPPELWNVEPFPGSQVLMINPNISFNLLDRISGIVPSSFQGNINGNLLSYSHPALTVNDSFFSFDPELAGLHINGGDTVSICLQVHDHADPFYCGPNYLDSCWYFYIPGGGPEAELTYPANNVFLSCEEAAGQIAEIFITDSNGVDPYSILLEVNGIIYTFDSTGLTFSEGYLRFSQEEPYPDGEVIEVDLLHVEDSLENVGNSLHFSYTIDISPPTLQFTNIAPDTTLTSTGFYFTAQLWDSVSGLDSSTV
ncbi:hypothetical protein JW877_06485, partial [bacterium]|nr:hypothetical protein [bacterium]